MNSPTPPPLKMVVASSCIPKDDPKHPPGGQDAHFIAAEEQWIGVADGVGSWKKRGIDSGVYARELMLNTIKYLVRNPKKHPKQVLEEAYGETTMQGSSTACILSFSSEDGGTLRGANVGDSGFLVIGNGAVLFRSPAQQWSFNHPFQLGTTMDDPSVAAEFEFFGVEKGYLVLLATDGLLDNLHESQILDILARHNDYLDLEELCRYIAKVAHFKSLDRYTDSPFSTEARRAGVYIGRRK